MKYFTPTRNHRPEAVLTPPPHPDLVARVADRLPDYAAPLAAFHRAHAPELEAMVAELPVRAGQRVLDLACGDGSWSGWLAERLGPSGRVVALDLSRAFLEVVSRGAASEAPAVSPVRGGVEDLPIAPGSLDGAWCAQSLFSLPSPGQALAAMREVVRPGGWVAVLENDTLHRMVLPWPPDLEIELERARLLTLERSGDDAEAFYVGRNLLAAMRDARLEGCVARAHATVRQGPLDDDERSHLGYELGQLLERAAPHLSDAARARLEQIVDDPESICGPDEFFVTYLDLVVVGRV